MTPKSSAVYEDELSFVTVLRETVDHLPHTGIGKYQNRDVWFVLESQERLEYVRGEEDLIGKYRVYAVSEKFVKRVHKYVKHRLDSLDKWDYRDFSCIDKLIVEYSALAKMAEVEENLITSRIE